MPWRTGFAAMARVRRQEFVSRVAFAAFVGSAAWVLTNDARVGLWFAAVFAAQLLDAAVGHQVLNGRTGRGWGALYGGALALSGAAFSGLGVLTWIAGGPAGQIFAILLPAAALLNTALIASRAAAVAPPIWAPHAAYMLGIPLISGVLSAERDLVGMACITVGAAVYIGHLRLALERLLTERSGRERAAAELEETQSALAAFVATVPASVMVTDRQLRILEASPDWLATFGLALESVRGRSVFDIAPEYFAPFRSAYERCLAGERIHAGRVPDPQPDGTLRYMRAELSPWRDGRGEIGGILVAALDITDMVEALDRTERSQQRLKLAVEIADLHVWEADYLRRTLETDGAAETFFDSEIDPETFLQDTNITIDPRDRELIADAWSAAVLEDRPFRPEYRVARRDGREVWATCTAKLVRDEAGRPLRLIGAMQNITERKAAEAELRRAKETAEAASLAKSTFLATISHEIRTPLNGVLGMAQAMAGDDLSPSQRERLSVIRESGETLLALLNDVLDLSKIEAGKLELEIAEFDLSALMRGAHAAFTAVAERKGLEFNLVVAPEARGRYRSDSTRIRQIVYNLVSNALKFTEDGEVRVSVDRTADGLVLEVADTGAGMPAEVLERLFEKFEQADASTTRRFGGTGLGLAICRELATLFGGEIAAESAPGRGSRFSVRLPLQPVGPEGDLADTAVPEVAAPATDLPLRVLAAEDNAVNQLVLRTLLHQFGLECQVVEDGQAALDAWRAADWDVILMDVQMPVMDGPTATRAIREAEARSGRPRTRIVALTANAMAHQIQTYLDAGMDGCIAKPIDARQLYEALAAPVEAVAA